MFKKSIANTFAIIFGFIAWFSMLAFVLGPATLNCDCFAADSAGNLYIGRKDSTTNTVFVYQNGTLVRSMPALTDRGYAFTIQADDTMLWTVGSDIIITDLYGNEIRRAEDPLFHMHTRLAHNMQFNSPDGTVYSKHLGFGTFSIYKNDTLIYEHPAYNQYILIAGIVSGVIVFFSVIWIVRLRKKDYYTGDG